MAYPGLPLPSPMPGPPPGAGPLPGPMPGSPGDTLPDMAMSALDQLGEGNPQSVALERVEQALSLAHKLLMSVLPQISHINPRVAKDLHQISQRVLDVSLNARKDMAAFEGPPPELMSLLMSNEGAPGGMEPKPLPQPSPFFGQK